MKRYILPLVILAGIFAGVMSLNNYRQSYGKVSIALDPGLKAQIFLVGEGSGQPKLLFGFVNRFDGKLKRGFYQVTTPPDSDYRAETVPFGVGPQAVELSIKPDYSDAMNDRQLKKELNNIHDAIFSEFPSQLGNYTILKGKLFDRGQWFGGSLKPIKPGGDILRVVLRSGSGGSWRVVTNPPEIVLSSVVYPDIPKEILSEINNFL